MRIYASVEAMRAMFLFCPRIKLNFPINHIHKNENYNI
jgi:hypothetical protein